MATIIEMVTHTRLDCVIGSAAGMRRGVAEAVWHARHRSAFGAPLVEQPLMVNVLADLALESEAATATALRLARAYDEGDDGAPPLRHRGAEVLDLQARDAARGRGARVPGRQRLRRGVADAAAAARRAAERDLGGLGQRDVASTCCARWRASPRACPRSWPSASSRAAATRGSTRTSTRCGAASTAATSRVARAARGRGPRAGVPGVAARALRAAGGGRRVLRRPARRGARPRVRHAAGGRRRRGDRRAGAGRLNCGI